MFYVFPEGVPIEGPILGEWRYLRGGRFTRAVRLRYPIFLKENAEDAEQKDFKKKNWMVMLDHVLAVNRADDRVRFASNTILSSSVFKEKLAETNELPETTQNFSYCTFITLIGTD